MSRSRIFLSLLLWCKVRNVKRTKWNSNIVQLLFVNFCFDSFTCVCEWLYVTVSVFHSMNAYIWVVSFNWNSLIAVEIFYRDRRPRTKEMAFRVWFGSVWFGLTRLRMMTLARLSPYLFMCFCTHFTWTNCCARLNLIIHKPSFSFAKLCIFANHKQNDGIRRTSHTHTTYIHVERETENGNILNGKMNTQTKVQSVENKRKP